MNTLLNFFEGFTQNAEQNDLVYANDQLLEDDLHGYTENYRFNEETQSFDNIEIADHIELLINSFREWEAEECLSSETETVLYNVEI